MDYSKCKLEIDKAVSEVCVQIIKEPLSYFSEADIQQLLVEELRKVEFISKLYSTSLRKGKGSKSVYKTSLVHREYGGGDRRRIDVVVFDDSDVCEINDVKLKAGKEYLRPAYAFELGTEKTSNTYTHLQNDLRKLNNRTKGTGYIIHFYKDDTLAKTGSGTRDNTEEKIDRKFKRVFEKQPRSIKNVKILVILLRTGRNQRKMRGKCEIFNGQEWVKTNVGRNNTLRKAILKQLE